MIMSGGTDAFTPGMMFGFSRMKVVSMAYNDRPAEASRPFDRGRDGFVLGEGAWMLVVEREDRARARGAKIYAAIEGYGSTCDAYHRVQMAPSGAEIVRAISTAIDRSGRRREEIGYINYHGTSTLINDAVESRCVRGVWRSRRAVPGSSVVDDRSSTGRERGRRRSLRRSPSSAGFCRPPSISAIPIRPAIRFHSNQDARPRSMRRSVTVWGLIKNSAIVIGACLTVSNHLVICYLVIDCRLTESMPPNDQINDQIQMTRYQMLDALIVGAGPAAPLPPPCLPDGIRADRRSRPLSA